jgi:hypothetical protein
MENDNGGLEDNIYRMDPQTGVPCITIGAIYLYQINVKMSR